MSKMIINKFGNKFWENEKGEFHRECGPSVECVDGTRYWHRDGKLHREDGPAMEYVSGHKEWYQNGLRHRENGAAIIFSGGNQEYWYCGIHYPEIKNDTEWSQLVRLMVLI